MQPVKYLIIVLCVVVRHNTQEIRSLDALLKQVIIFCWFLLKSLLRKLIPFTLLTPPISHNLEPIIIHEPIDPCDPSPCGLYSQCRVVGSTGVCSCLPNYISRPPNCRPECTMNSECPGNRACINERCKDPCPGSCGFNALCNVVNHSPVCTCITGYQGDPFSGCNPIPRKILFSILSSVRILINDRTGDQYRSPLLTYVSCKYTYKYFFVCFFLYNFKLLTTMYMYNL